MHLIRFIILLYMGNCVFFYFDTALQLVCFIAGMMDLIRFIMLLCMGTLCNCALFYLIQH